MLNAHPARQERVFATTATFPLGSALIAFVESKGAGWALGSSATSVAPGLGNWPVNPPPPFSRDSEGEAMTLGGIPLPPNVVFPTASPALPTPAKMPFGGTNHQRPTAGSIHGTELPAHKFVPGQFPFGEGPRFAIAPPGLVVSRATAQFAP